MRPVLLCIDAAFSNMGFAIVELLKQGEDILEVGVICTSKDKNKVLASEDNVKRCRELYVGLKTLWDHLLFKPILMCVESMSFPQNFGAATKIALSWGVIISFAEAHKIPIVGVSPQAIKKVLCGKNNASKEEVQEAVKFRYGIDKLDALHTGVNASQQEHPYDAIAAMVACLQRDLVLLARQSAVR